MFFGGFCEISRNTFPHRTPLVAASICRSQCLLKAVVKLLATRNFSKGLIVWKILSWGEIIITQPSWNFISPCHCFQYKKQITSTCKKLNSLSRDEISSRLADPELKLSSRMKHYFSPYNCNFSLIPGWKQKKPFIQKFFFIKINLLKFSSRDKTSQIIVKIATRRTELKFRSGMKNVHIISPQIWKSHGVLILFIEYAMERVFQLLA